MDRFVIAMYVENKYGVLTRVCGLFMRKGFNIDSLTVGETDDSNYSRITITLHGDEYAREQLVNQLRKLHNIKKVKLLTPEASFEKELMLIKVKSTPQTRSEILAATEVYKGKILDYTLNTISIEVTGDPSKINAFIEIMASIGIIEMCRTGVVAIERGTNSI